MASSSTEATHLFCGPEDPNVLYLQPHHISASIMCGNKGDSFQCRKLDNNIFKAPMHERVLEHIQGMGFGGVYLCGKPKQLDAALIGALIERWRPETHTFHLPVGETTVTLQDVEVLWGLRVDGDPVILSQVKFANSYWTDICTSMLGIVPSETELRLGGFSVSRLKHVINEQPLGDDLAPHYYMERARIFVLLLLGCLIMPDTSGRKIPFHYLLLLIDEDQSSRLSWGGAALATLYHFLCEAACEKRTDIGGPLALLQMWAWERIPNIRPEIVDPDEYDGTIPRAIM